MKNEIEKLTDQLGLEFDEDGNFRVRIFEEDIDIIAQTLSYGTVKELIQAQIDSENYEGAETLKQVIARKDELQEIQRNRKLLTD
jgi:hypothetical protein